MTTANIRKGGLLAGAIMMAMTGSGQAMPASMALAG
ncbi:transglutaminase, partial [Rhizobium ruizarguesonis]